MAWVVPGLAILVAGGAIFVGLRRWRRADNRAAADAPAELGAEDAARLKADLERYGE